MYVIATEETPNSSNKTERFGYKGEWANVYNEGWP